MVTIRVCCDRCGEAILEDRVLLKVECGSMRDRRQAVDLCRGCTQEFEGFLSAFSIELEAVRSAGLMPSLVGSSVA